MSDENQRNDQRRGLREHGKPGVRVLNTAPRAGSSTRADLAEAIRGGEVAGAALDVYETEPPPKDFALHAILPQVITSTAPYRAPSTDEAQENVGDRSRGGNHRLPVERRGAQCGQHCRILMPKRALLVKPYLALGEKLGRLVAQLAPKRN